MNINKIFLKIIILGTVISLISLASEMTYQDELAEQDYYCAGVQDGLWPNFKGLACDKPILTKEVK